MAFDCTIYYYKMICHISCYYLIIFYVITYHYCIICYVIALFVIFGIYCSMVDYVILCTFTYYWTIIIIVIMKPLSVITISYYLLFTSATWRWLLHKSRQSDCAQRSTPMQTIYWSFKQWCNSYAHLYKLYVQILSNGAKSIGRTLAWLWHPPCHCLNNNMEWNHCW